MADHSLSVASMVPVPLLNNLPWIDSNFVGTDDVMVDSCVATLNSFVHMMEQYKRLELELLYNLTVHFPVPLAYPWPLAAGNDSLCCSYAIEQCR